MKPEFKFGLKTENLDEIQAVFKTLGKVEKATI